MALPCLCGEKRVSGSYLCHECRDEIASPHPLCPEQIQSTAAPGSDGALIDQWGRAHSLRSSSRIGRHSSNEVSVLDISLSRYHAELRLDVATSTWLLRDLGSTNGTWCGGERITTPLPLVSSTAIWFAQVGFYFVSPAATEEQSDESLLVETQIGRGEGPGREDLDPEEGERTHPGLPAMQLELFEPVGGGGGFLVLDGQRVQLSASQFELLRALARRMFEQSEQPEIVRGFVRSSELISDLPWDTAHPGDNHLKQLVRRLRRTLGMFDLGHIIESRQGLGYRLRIRPLTTPTPESPGTTR